MSAGARGAAGALYMRRIRGRRAALRPSPDDVEAFIAALTSRGISEPRARELAAEQQTKTFNRPRSGARR